MRCEYTVFGYKHFLTAINYFGRFYTTFEGYILLLTVTYYFPAISRVYELKTRLEFNINLLALIQFCFFCSPMVNILFRSTLSLIKQIIKVKNKIR